jgi:hypothetical protein
MLCLEHSTRTEPLYRRAALSGFDTGILPRIGHSGPHRRRAAIGQRPAQPRRPRRDDRGHTAPLAGAQRWRPRRCSRRHSLGRCVRMARSIDRPSPRPAPPCATDPTGGRLSLHAAARGEDLGRGCRRVKVVCPPPSRASGDFGYMFGYMESPRAGPITWIDPALLVVLPQRVEPMGGLEPPTGCLRTGRGAVHSYPQACFAAF